MKLQLSTTWVFIIILLMAGSRVWAQNSITARTVANGAWTTASTWSANGTILLPPQDAWGNGTSNVGEYIIIEHDINIPNNQIIDLSTSGVKEVRIKSNKSLTFGSNARLLLPAGAKIVLEEGARIVASNNSSGTLIEIGGNGVWGTSCQSEGCSNDTLVGAGTMDENSNPGTPLPVELLYFRAEVASTAISLDWATAMEENFDYFTLERAGEEGRFEAIADIRGAGFSTEEVSYHFKDEHPLPGLNLYRLKATDFDGSEEYHHIVSAWVTAQRQELISVYPNPLLGNEALYINSSSTESQQVNITDLSGNIIASTSIQGLTSQIQLPEALKPGYYLISVIQADGAQQHIRLLKH